MKKHIDQIRDLLSHIEEESLTKEVDSFERNYDALELPTLVAQIVDYLQPKLHPYEAAMLSTGTCSATPLSQMEPNG